MSGTTLFSSIQNMQSCYLLVCNLHVSNPTRTQGEGLAVMVNVPKGDTRIKMENPIMNESSSPQGAVKYEPHQLLKICF